MEEHKEKEEYVCLATYMGAVTLLVAVLKALQTILGGKNSCGLPSQICHHQVSHVGGLRQ